MSGPGRAKQPNPEKEKTGGGIGGGIHLNSNNIPVGKAENNQWLSFIVAHLPAYVFLVAADYTIFYSNQYFRERFGDPENEPCYRFLHGRSQPCQECRSAMVLQSQQPMEWDWLEAPDNRAYRVSNYPFQVNPDTWMNLEVGLDITQRLEAENQLKAYSLALENSNQELREFAYVASHDLQEPLRKIAGFSRLIRKRYGGRLDDKGIDYLWRLESATRRMRNLIRALLAYSRLNRSPKTFQAVDLNVLLAEVKSDIEGLIKQAKASVTSDPLISLAADPVQMRQLFQNLISNGLKFNESPQPHVHITGQMVGRPDAAAAADLPAVEAAQWYQLSVRDNGIGFDPAFANRIFSPFQRLHDAKAFEGSGIGLSICRRIVSRHGGTIVAQSSPGSGATFMVTLPVRKKGLLDDENKNCYR